MAVITPILDRIFAPIGRASRVIGVACVFLGGWACGKGALLILSILRKTF